MESSYFFNQSFQDIFYLFFSFYKGIFSYQNTTYIVLQLFNLFLFIFFFFFQPFIGLDQAIQSLLQVLFWRKGGDIYSRYTSHKSHQFGYFFCRFLGFFFSRKLRISSFFSCPKQAKRRRRGRKSEYRLIVTYFYRRFFLYLLGFSILQGGFLVFIVDNNLLKSLISQSQR